MKRWLDVRLLLVFLNLSIISLHIPIVVVDSGVLAPPRISPPPHDASLQSEIPFSLTWTSRWQSEPQLVTNGTIATGDHVVLNATFNIPDIIRVDLLVNDSISSNHEVLLNASGQQLTYDTYLFGTGQNMTTNITVWGHTLSNVTFTFYYLNVAINNFFAPNLEVYSPIEIAPPPSTYSLAQFSPTRSVWTFTWSCTDLNANDTNYYSVWLSADRGMTFLLLQRNLTENYYVWDSTGFLELDSYIYRVRAYSLDFTIQDEFNNSLCSVDAPPQSYWPGDYADGISTEFSNTGPGAQDGPPNIAVNHPSDLFFLENEKNRRIVWGLSADASGDQVASVSYTVFMNGSAHFSGSIEIAPSTTKNVTLNIDDLSVGVYEFTIRFLNLAYPLIVVEDTIIVTISSSASVLFLAAGISGGMLLGVLVLELVRRVYVRRKNTGAPEEEAPDFSILLLLEQ
ncbi:MAG: hypothetical protein ACFFCP_07620 [Promethearchaeota archaeon]